MVPTETGASGVGDSQQVPGGVSGANGRYLSKRTSNHAAQHAKDFINTAAVQAKHDNLVVSDDVFNDIVARKLNETSDEKLPVYVPIVLTLGYTVALAEAVMYWEGWSFTEAVYFLFITFSTIGFGDYTPFHRKYFLAVSICCLLGLALVAMVIQSLMTLTQDTLEKAKVKVNENVERRLGVQLDEDSAAARPEKTSKNKL